MKRFKGTAVLILAAFLAAMFVGCDIPFQIGNAVIGNGQMDTKTISLAQELTGIQNMSSIDVVIDPSLEGEAAIEAESNIIDLVELEQNAEGSLSVSFKAGTNVSLSKGVTVRIPAVNGGDIEISGSGNISLDSSEPLKGDAFAVQVQGSGDISLKLDTTNLEVKVDGSGDMDLVCVCQQIKAGITGSGNILMTGYADSAEISLGGSGDFDGFEFALINADVSATGSGNVNVNVSSSLTGRVSGSGDVIYDGNPNSVNMTSSGSGDVVPR